MDIFKKMNWTIVTGYFDVKRYKEDINHSQNESSFDKEKFLELSEYTLGIDKNMIIFCEEDMLPRIKERRKNFSGKTHYIVTRLEDMPLWQYRNRIIKNRQGNSYYNNNRNTPTYFLLVTSKFTMFQRAIKENPFSSSHFMWIDFGLSKTKMNPDRKYLDLALAENRDKFSVCYIDYTPVNVSRNYSEYYKHGRCGTAAGVMSGNIEYISKVSDAVVKYFKDTVNTGYGHAEEQFLPLVYLDHPEWFQFWYGDYDQLIINYVHIRDIPEKILFIFIQNTIGNKMWSLALDACKELRYCLLNGLCSMNDEYLLKFCIQYYLCAWSSGTDKKEAIEAVKLLAKWTNEKGNFKNAVLGNLDFLIGNTDFLLPYLEKKDVKVIKDRSEAAGGLDSFRYVLYSKDNLDGSVFCTSNPIIRPEKYIIRY